MDRGFRCASTGLLLGAMSGLIILILQRTNVLADSSAPWFVLMSATVLAFFVGILWPTSWQSVARLVDSACGLKDRSVSALDFSRRPKLDELQTLQIQDTIQHLDTIDAKQVVRWTIPRLTIPGILTTGLMLVVAFFPGTNNTAVASAPEAIPVVLEQAQLLEETMLEDLKQLAEENKDEELMELAEQLEAAIEEMKQPEVDEREALASLSEMQQAITVAMEQLNVEQVDAQMKEFAQAMEAAKATQAASQAIESGEYEKAAEELEKIDASSMERKDREAVTANLAKLSKKLGEAKKGQLSQAVSEMLEGLENEEFSKCKSGMCKAAGVCRKQGTKKSICECLGCQLNRLAECKGACQCNKSGPNEKVAKSDSPSNNWGTGKSGQPTGDEKTKLDSTRREENVTGISGDGPSERETSTTLEARQDASRNYKERYAQFKKEMEQVLDSEPLPLGHRETARKYFESIRPKNGEEDK
ncbi:MAG: hypothetical protein ABL888_04030 [Pirellulaceae bacterium]